jgi:hypothetical protein
MSEGFVYVATGPKYVAEAVESARGLKRVMPAARVCLISEAPADPVFDDSVRLEDPAFGFRDKLHMHRAPYDRAVFLDSDVYVCGDISGLFALLDTHDIAARLEAYPGWDYTLPGVPTCFPEYTTGLIAFRRSAAAAEFFRAWERAYAELAARGPRFVPDQPSFRHALFHSAARHCALPIEYHLQGDMGGFVFWDVKVVHSRRRPDRLAAALNRRLGPRFYDPVAGVIPCGYTGLAGQLKTWGRLNWDRLKVVARAVRRKVGAGGPGP